jgi:hypothetical protein
MSTGRTAETVGTRTRLFLAGTFSLLLAGMNTTAQDIAPKLNPAPLERPLPILVIPNAVPTNLLAVARQCLATNGFDFATSDALECMFDARKPVRINNGKGYDRVIFWLGRRAAEPDTVEVYMLFGEYIELFGRPTGRVLLSKDKEDELTQPWKPQLIAILKQKGP